LSLNRCETSIQKLPHAFVRTAVAQGRGGQAPPLAPPINQSLDPLLKNFRFRSIGPANIGG